MSTTISDFLRHLRSLTARQAIGGLSDQQLLERFRLERSQASFAVLVQRHGPMVLSLCCRVLHHAQDAEDAFQATFLVLAKKAAMLRQPLLLSGWLHGVAYHVALRLKAKAHRRAVHEHRIEPPPTGDALDDISWRELRTVLDEELQRLPEKHRAPLVLCYLEGRTQDEAARQLGWSKSTFRRRLESGRDRLGRRLTRRGLTLSAVLSAPLLAAATAQASLLPLLAASTVRAGLASSQGNSVSGIVSAHVVALAEGGVRSLLAKKASITVVALVSLTLGIGGLLAHRTLQSRTLADAPAAPKTSPPVPTPPQPARSASKHHTIELNGRVLDPDGKPFVGARLLLLSAAPQKKTDKLVRATTDREGRFHFRAQPAHFDAEGTATLTATANGFGPDWIKVKSGEQDAVTLRLVKDDVPIEGRVLDLEGQPIPGVRIHVNSLMRGDLDTWLKRILAADPGMGYPQLPERIGSEILGESASAVSGKDGRFRLTGVGRDRVVDVQLRGEKVEASDFEVVTRLKLPPGLPKTKDFGIYPPRSDYLAGPNKSIVGTVRDKRTGKPLAGISVTYTGQTPSWLWTTTDAQGRYRISGVGKRKQYWVAAGGPPYFNCTKLDVADTPGLEPITVDFALERGIAVHGKLFNKVTGRPIRVRVQYVQLPDNPNLKDFTDINKLGVAVSDTGKTNADGSFTVVAIPGPGLLAAMADDVNRFARMGGAEHHHHAEIRINPSENDPKSTTCEITLEPASLLKGSVFGPDGKPLAGAYAAGCLPIIDPNPFARERLDSYTFTVGGLKPGRPRVLAFYHRQKRLGKVLVLQGDETKTLNVRLEPLGAIAGRILDAKGRPWAGLKVCGCVIGIDDKTYPAEFCVGTAPWSKMTHFEITTDREGRFHIEGLLPGLKYGLEAAESEIEAEPKVVVADDWTVESGKTKDLGDLKSKPVPDKRTKEKP